MGAPLKECRPAPPRKTDAAERRETERDPGARGQRRNGVSEGPAGRRAHVDVPAEDDSGPHPVGRPGRSRRVGDSLVGGSGVPVVFRVVGVQERLQPARPGLNSLFCTLDEKDPGLRADRRGPLPASNWQELRQLLRRHLYVEGDPRERIRVDEHSVRAATDDDEVDLAYYFFDDTLAAASDRSAYLLWEDWRLPVDAGPHGRGFDEPEGIQRLTTRHGGTGTTYLVALRPGDLFERGNLVPPAALVGVRLPELAPYLRSVRPKAADPD
jgi:hypothetical protein